MPRAEEQREDCCGTNHGVAQEQVSLHAVEASRSALAQTGAGQASLRKRACRLQDNAPTLPAARKGVR